MSGNWDANIKLVYPVDAGTDFTVDTVQKGAEFDVIANVEVGKTLRGFGPGYDLKVWVRNLSKSDIAAMGHVTGTIPASNDPWNEELRVQIPQNAWNVTADVDDVLEVVAAFKVAQGVNIDQSAVGSDLFMVSAP